MASFTDPSGRLIELIDRSTVRFQTRFIQIIKEIQDDLPLETLETLIEQGRMSEALSLLDIDLPKLGRPWGEAFILSGDETATFIGNALQINIGFNTVNERALNIMKENQLRLIRQFTQAQRDATREALTSGIERGINPRDMAREFRESIGLTRRQVRAVNNYQRLLESPIGADKREALTRALRDKRFDRTVLRAIREDRQLSRSQINNMVKRYREKYLKYRSEVIARTESLNSVHAGADEMYQQAIDAGTLDPVGLTRQWDTARDPRVREPAHVMMQGQLVTMGQPFISGLGNQLIRPGDPSAPPEEVIQCRCAVLTRYKSTTPLKHF